jgi:hypothetical protein
MGKFSNLYGGLCKPAQFYLVISIFGLLFMLVQNIGATDRFTLGMYSAPHSNPMILLVVNALYIAVWTWMLNILCRINTNISWIIVLFPFILFFIAIGLMLFGSGK